MRTSVCAASIPAVRLMMMRDARSVAYALDMPYYVFNFADRFKTDVIDKFCALYETGVTPNPCIDCNRYFEV